MWSCKNILLIVKCLLEVFIAGKACLESGWTDVKETVKTKMAAIARIPCVSIVVFNLIKGACGFALRE